MAIAVALVVEWDLPLGLVKRVKQQQRSWKEQPEKCPSLDFAIAFARYTRFVRFRYRDLDLGLQLPDMPLEAGLLTFYSLQLRSLVISQQNTKEMLRQQGCKPWPNAPKMMSAILAPWLKPLRHLGLRCVLTLTYASAKS